MQIQNCGGLWEDFQNWRKHLGCLLGQENYHKSCLSSPRRHSDTVWRRDLWWTPAMPNYGICKLSRWVRTKVVKIWTESLDRSGELMDFFGWGNTKAIHQATKDNGEFDASCLLEKLDNLPLPRLTGLSPLLQLWSRLLWRFLSLGHWSGRSVKIQESKQPV